MNQLTNKLLSNYNPVTTIVVYNNNGNYYLETHKVLNNGSLGPGTPVSFETIEEIVESFYKEEKKNNVVTGLLPKNILAFENKSRGKYKMIWYKSACRRQLFFTKPTKLKSLEYNIPATIFKVEDNQLYVYCYNNNDITLTTELLMPAYYNTSDNGYMCLGNAKAELKSFTYEALIEYWESLFFNSFFSHVNDEEKCISKSLKKAWQKALDKDFDWSTELLPYEKTKTIKSIL
jgi:PRTRC genetic system protein B